MSTLLSCGWDGADIGWRGRSDYLPEKQPKHDADDQAAKDGNKQEVTDGSLALCEPTAEAVAGAARRGGKGFGLDRWRPKPIARQNIEVVVNALDALRSCGRWRQRRLSRWLAPSTEL